MVSFHNFYFSDFILITKMRGDCAFIVRPENITLRPKGGFNYFSLFSKLNTLHKSQRKIKYLLTVGLFKVTRTKMYKKKYGKVCT